MAIDYDQILYDLQTAINANIASLQNTFVEGDAHEIENMSNMPLANFRIDSESIFVQNSNIGYNAQIEIYIDIIAFNLANFEDAASERSDLVIAVKNYLMAYPRFSNNILSSQINSISFASPTASTGGVLAIATISVTCTAYAE